MRERAKTKKDGVYPFAGYNFYLVIDNQLAGYSDLFGNIYELASGFSVSKGKAKDRWEARDILKGYLKQFKENKSY
jgi:hypothetical protein